MTDPDPQLALARRALALRADTIKKEKRKMGDDLIRQLKEAGHEEAANSVRDRELAKQLEAAGHTGLAAQLTGERAPEAPKDPVQAEAEEFLAVLKDKNASAWTSAGGLLDR